MRFSTLLALAALLSSMGCVNSPTRIDDHWSAQSLSPRISRQMLGYDANRHGDSYKDFAWEKKQHINKTMLRHFFNHNPENPFQPAYEGQFYGPRPVNSPLPNVWPYFHVEGAAIGALWLSGGYFIPIPIDSIIGTLEEGGEEEFMEGLETFAHPLGVFTVSFINGAFDPIASVITRLEE